MAEITDHIDKSGRTTTHVVVGTISLDEVLLTMTEFNTERMTPNVLWDFTRASLIEIGSRELRAIVDHWKTLRHLREGGKTALLVERALEFGVARMFQAHLHMNDLDDRVLLFRDREEAMEWLEHRD